MAVTDNLNLWASTYTDSSDQNVTFDSSSAFNSNVTKAAGFEPGKQIPSKPFNTILRELTLGNKALFNVLKTLNPSATITLGTETSISSLTTFVQTAFTQIVAKALSGTTVYSIPYQSASGITGYLSPTTIAGTYVLTQTYDTQTHAPVWTNTNTLSVNHADSADSATYAEDAASAYSATRAGFANSSTFADTIESGEAGNVLYQQEPSVTKFTNAGNDGDVLVTVKNASTSNEPVPTFVSPSDIKVGDSAKADYATAAGSSSTAESATDAANVTTNINGVAITDIFEANQNQDGITATVKNATNADSATTADNIVGGNAGDIFYQADTGQTLKLPKPNADSVLTFNPANNNVTPSWTAKSDLSTGSTAIAENLKNGAAGKIPYQTATNTTSFTEAGTNAQVLITSVTTVEEQQVITPTWTDQSSLSVGYATSAGSADSASSASSADYATSAGTADSATSADSATTATNIAGGNTNQIPYQTGTDTTGFITAPSARDMVLATSENGSGNTEIGWASASNLSVNHAATADSATSATNATNAANATIATNANNAYKVTRYIDPSKTAGTATQIEIVILDSQQYPPSSVTPQANTLYLWY